MICKTYAPGSLKEYKFVVVLSEYQNKILYPDINGEIPGKPRAATSRQERPMDAARRELFEESGAVDFDLESVCDYWAGEEGVGVGANGMVFRAVIHRLGGLPDSEMAETRTFDALPDNLTYPEITPVLFRYLGKLKRLA